MTKTFPVLLFLLANTASCAVQYLLSITGPNGAVLNNDPILSFNWGSTSTQGKPRFLSSSIQRNSDMNTPVLYKYHWAGQHFPKVVVKEVNGANTITYTLSDAILTSISVAGGGTQEEGESMQFDFTKVNVVATDGAGKSVAAGFDSVKDQPV